MAKYTDACASHPYLAAGIAGDGKKCFAHRAACHCRLCAGSTLFKLVSFFLRYCLYALSRFAVNCGKRVASRFLFHAHHLDASAVARKAGCGNS